ncbi:MAG: ABC transporter permease [Sphingobacteriales bacterium 17-39-43]|nr:MAG: ABC transporter permease [Sphingobacteriia bacterium 35-40-5]OYZ32610.1 MAG: ABC transporter permease [Sphingobacteriales bacterium 16-39-50]OYZ59395.1 MAG: ABC transporter permease [Sphingobacteriales bacterium 24-40-4]OZA25974.1 MAG: ABC transporter permease [Sphingobacteriales bacterium 17-39-43]
MAWRDSRRNRSRLFLFISSIILGIAALVAIYSFEYNLRNDIDSQAKSLLGADLIIETNKTVKEEALPMLKSLGTERSEERTFASMVYFQKNGGTRLVNVRALSGDFPYYGDIETTPKTASRSFRLGKQALVDKTLMLQYDAKPGDSIKVGEVIFEIAGVLNKAPGQTGFNAAVAPIVYIPLAYLEETGLSQKGSRITYNFYYKFPPETNVNKLAKRLEPQLEKAELDYETIESRKENTGRSFEDMTEFLALVGFIALLLGCIGVASAIHIYIREKINTIAVLRCLGASSRQAFLIYLIQIAGIGLIGSLIGSILGTLIQQFLPIVLKDFLPVEIAVAISWMAVGQGLLLGLIISILFALLPLVSVRNISPLNTLRLSLEETSLFKDPIKWLVYFIIVLFIFGFTYLQMGSLKKTVFFTAGVLAGFITLAALAYAMMWLARRYFPSSWSYLWRQGFANLFRPNNQTLILVVSIGLGTAFICTLFFVQGILINRVTRSSSKNQPNMVLFDIQSNQKQAVADLTKSLNLPVLQEVPIVNMRMTEIKGRNAASYKKDSVAWGAMRGLEREYRVTYRDSLSDSEELIDGKWIGKAEPGKPVYVSLEDGYAKRIGVKIGDELTFNVQGAPLKALVGSTRKVDWNRIQTNFILIFPTGVLEDAPQFHVLLTQVPSNELSAKYQQAVVKTFPNISMIDLGLVLSVLDEILDKMGFVIRFMAAFSIITGLIVLIASVLISKYQRIRESVLLRTMGASRKQILVITALEYFFLGALAAGAGIVLALVASWGLARFVFETTFSPELVPVLILFLLITSLTVLVGLFNSRGVLNRPPLEVLRSEV